MTVTGPASPSSAIDWNTLKGSLLFFDIGSLETGINTAYGQADAIRADVSVLDGPSAGAVFENVLVFPKVLVNQLFPRVHGKVVARLGQGNGKPGQSPPWMLTDPTPDELQRAVTWDQQRNGPTPPAPPAAQQQGSQPFPVPQPNPGGFPHGRPDEAPF